MSWLRLFEHGRAQRRKPVPMRPVRQGLGTSGLNCHWLEFLPAHLFLAGWVALTAASQIRTALEGAAFDRQAAPLAQHSWAVSTGWSVRDV